MTDNSNETLDEKYLRETVEEMNLKFFDWLKNITTIAAGLIAVLVSLKNSNNHQQQKLPDTLGNCSTGSNGLFHFQELTFFATILLFSLGILFSVVVLFQQVALLQNTASKYHSRIQDKQTQHVTPNRPDTNFATGMQWFSLLKRLALLFYLLGLISLVTYSYFISGI